MDVSLDTDITIHLYNAGKENLLFGYFDTLYIHEFILEREIKNKSLEIYKKIKQEIEKGKIINVTQRYLIDIGMKTIFEKQLWDIKELFDFGEANAVALATTLGISALVTDDTKPFGPHETLLNEIIEDVMPFAFYELLYLEYLKSDDAFDEFVTSYDKINMLAYPKRPMSFLSRIKRVISRFSNKRGVKRDVKWMMEFCERNAIIYKDKMQILYSHLKKYEENNQQNNQQNPKNSH